MSNLPLVSVISIYYNRTYKLAESVESILNQTYPNFEFILIDDKSTDGKTYEALSEYRQHSNVFLHLNEENIGFVRSIRKAIQLARGTFIAIHGSGDISAGNRLELQINKFFTLPSDTAVVSCLGNYQNRRTGEEYIRATQTGLIELDDIIRSNPIIHGSVMMKRSYYDQVDGYRPFFKYRQDRDLWTRISLLGKVYVINQPLYTVTVQEMGVSSTLKSKFAGIFYSLFIDDLIGQRMTYGRDTVDVFGDDAKFFFDLERASHRIYKMLLNSLLKNRREEGLKIVQFCNEFNIRGKLPVRVKILIEVFESDSKYTSSQYIIRTMRKVIRSKQSIQSPKHT